MGPNNVGGSTPPPSVVLLPQDSKDAKRLPFAQIKFCKTLAEKPDKTVKINYDGAIQTFSSMVEDCDPITGSPKHYVFSKWDDKEGRTTVIYNPNKKDGKDALVTFRKTPEQYANNEPPKEERQDVKETYVYESKGATTAKVVVLTPGESGLNWEIQAPENK